MLREWVNHEAKIELIADPGGMGLSYTGKIVAIGDDFMFIGKSGVRATLFPLTWKDCESDALSGIWRSLYISTSAGRSLTLREGLSRDISPNLDRVMTQLQQWEKFGVVLGVSENRGAKTLFFVGTVKKLQDGAFSFIQSNKTLQLMVSLPEVRYMNVLQQDGMTVLILSNENHEHLLIYDTRPDEPLKKLPLISVSVH